MSEIARAAKGSSWASTVLVFVAGFALAFAATVVLINLGPSPLWVWCLLALVGFMLSRLPLLKTPLDRTSAFAAYAIPFLTLWTASNPAPKYSLKDFIFHTLLGLFGLASLLAVGIFIGIARKSLSLKKFSGALLLLFLFCWLVAFFSSSTGSGSRMIAFAMDYFGMSRPGAETFVLVFRKSIHFAFYGSLGLLALRAAKAGGMKMGAAAFALLFVLLHCSFDEIRQSSYVDRTGSFWDVCLDMGGALAFIGAAQALRKSTRRAVSAHTARTSN